MRPTPENPVVVWRFSSRRALDAVPARNDFLSFLGHHSCSVADEHAAAIIYSELVANVVCHAPGPIVITLEVGNSSTILRVADSGPGFNFEPSLPRSFYNEHGRGLFIVSQYAAEMQIERQDGAGTRVSATLPFSLDLRDMRGAPFE